MEMQAFTERGSPHNDATTLRNRQFAWCLGACFVLWVLSLLPFLIACLHFHHKQPPKPGYSHPCWFHASSPVSPQTDIQWTWTGNCSSSSVNTTESSLKILESSMYFTYIYVACKETCFSNEYFTVKLASSKEILSVLKGTNGSHAFVNLGRPYFLEKGTSLHLQINAGLKYIDINRTYWGLFKI